MALQSTKSALYGVVLAIEIHILHGNTIVLSSCIGRYCTIEENS